MISACSFDLETSSLDGDWGIILCAVIKPAGQKGKLFRIDELSKDWVRGKRSNDKPLVEAIVKELSRYDVVAAHFGSMFDFPFLRTRMLAHGMPPLPKQKLIDPWSVAKKNLKFKRNSLDSITSLLGCNSKTSVDQAVWRKAMFDGDRKALKYISDHCLADCEMLEQVVIKLKGYCTTFNCWGSGF